MYPEVNSVENLPWDLPVPYHYQLHQSGSSYSPLLVGGDTLLVLDLSLDILDGVGRLHLKSDGLTREGLHEDLHLGFLIQSYYG